MDRAGVPAARLSRFIILTFTTFFFLLWTIVQFSDGNTLYQKCSSTLSCDDPGLICYDGRCVCIYDTGAEAVKFWKCNTVRDCEGPIRFASDQLTYAGHDLASEMLNVEEPKCSSSLVCPNPKDYHGYCDIFWPDGDALV